MSGSYPGRVAGAPPLVEAIIEALPQPVALLDEAMIVVAANSRFTQTFSEDQPGCGLKLPGSIEAVERLRQEVAVVGTAECVVKTELPNLGPRELVLHASRLARAGAGRPGILLTVEDVTDGAGARRGSGQRPAAPAAQDMAGELAGDASRAAGPSRVLAAATHDLRQPLQAMTLLGSLLARRITDPTLLPLIRRLEDTVTVMSNMLSMLLDINRWDAGALPTSPTDFALQDLFGRLDGEFSERMHNLRMRWRVVPSARIVHTDQRLLMQMLRNIINYALERWQDGRILVGARRHGQRVRVEVWCTVPETDEATAEAMIQAVTEGLRPGPARVLPAEPVPVPGLAMIRRIADLLGHRIHLARRPGGGAVFTVELPLGMGPSTETAPPPSIPAPPTPAKPARGTVFVIDADPMVCDELREVLGATGWAIQVFSRGEQFLETDQPNRAGCVLIDVLLPGMTGMAVLRQLKDHRHRLPAIMLIGAADVRMAVEAMAGGALNFIEKPIRYDELLPVVERAFDTLAATPNLASAREQTMRRAASLTARQRQILEMVLAGEPSGNIAADLGLSRRTVENHRAIIMKKMGVASIPQLIRAGMAVS